MAAIAESISASFLFFSAMLARALAMFFIASDASDL
jgi:hypothetical protein